MNWLADARSFSLLLLTIGTGMAIGMIQPNGTSAIVPESTASSQPSSSLIKGSQMQLNGRTVSASWLQTRSQGAAQIAVSDVGLQQAIGIQPTNTTSAKIQPVQWFSPAGQSSVLPTQLTPTTRYLDLTKFAHELGWQVSGVDSSSPDSTLHIATPAARIVSLRQTKQSWGDRLIIELDQATPWQSDQTGSEISLEIDAQIDPAVVQQFQPVSDSTIDIQVKSDATQTQLQVNAAPGQQARIWSLSAPNRIVVDIRPNPFGEQDTVWAPGLRWRQQLLPLGTDRVPVIWLEVDPKQPGLSLQPILPNSTMMMGTARLAQTAQQAQAAAAINGGFFNRDRQLPLGAIRQNGRWLSGPILNRGAIGWDAAGNAQFDRLTLQETVVIQTGLRLPLTHLNSGYLQAGIARYTPDWGSTYTSLSDGEIIVLVQNDQVTSQQAIAKAGTLPIAIPPDGYLLVLRSNRSVTTAFAPGTTLRLEAVITPFNAYPSVIGAGPLLIQNQRIVLDAKAESFSNAFAIESAARSAIAQRADGTILLVAVPNRITGGVTLPELAQLLQQLGAVNALNLDGGSSTTLYLGGQLLDRSPATAARVHNGIGVFLNPKTSP